MRGFADLHVHMFSHLAFGGAVMTGAPYHDEGMATALAPDYGTDLDLTNPLSGPPQLVVACPQAVPNCGKNILHGDHVVVGIGFDDPVGAGAVPPDATRSYFGAPVFSGWPTWHSATHQQVYYKWLERAWRGGMRLMTMLAVNNEAACSISKRLRNQDGSAKDCRLSMKEIDDQLRAARTFEKWLDAQPGGGWFRIVKTPREAETVIREGKLAVVLGIEVDSLFNCKQDSSDAACGEAFVDQQVERYYSEFDVRYIYPTHDFDGAFAGTALFIPILELGNLIIEGHFWRTEPCEDSDFHPFMDINALRSAPQNSPRSWPLEVGPGKCNAKGLTSRGEKLVHKLMSMGMLIDIDHMSRHAIERTISLANEHHGYPLMVGHALFNEMHARGKNRHERMRTRGQLDALRPLGGLVAVMTQDEMKKDDEPECMHSSRSFEKNYSYAVNHAGADGPGSSNAVAFGTDFNGVAPHVGPRFGEDACGGDREQRAQEHDKPRLKYPFTLPGFGSFEKLRTGQREFDFNMQGLANIGLLPDLIADVMLQGADVEPLMHSAQAVVESWKKAVAASQSHTASILNPRSRPGKNVAGAVD